MKHILVLLLFCLPFSGCEGCGCEDSAIIARLVGQSGVVERDFSTQIGQWEAASIGATFVMGDGVRAKDGSGAVLRLTEGSELHLKEKTQIRFLASEDNINARGIDVETGEAEIVVGDAEFELMTKVGRAVMAKNSRVRISKSKGGVNFEVQIGNASFETTDGSETLLQEGDRIEVGIGTATVVKIGEQELEQDTEEGPTLDFQVGDGDKGNLVSVDALGRGIRLRRPDGTRWELLKKGGSELQPATIVRIPARAKLKVARGREKVTLHGPGTFRLGEANQPIVHSSRGKITLAANDVEVVVSVPGGRIVALAGEPGGTKARVRTGGGKSNIAVQQGRVKVLDAEEENTLSAGEKLTVVKKRPEEQIDLASVTSGPDVIDIGVQAGESFVVHVAEPPAAIRFRTGQKCPLGSLLRLSDKASRGQDGGVSMNIAQGRHRYTVQCIGESGKLEGKAAFAGNVIVTRDSGRARLPSKAPTSMVEADGRKYRVIYQNLLPKIYFSWRKAPKSASYAVIVAKNGGGTKRFTTGKPEYAFSAGSLRDGVHRLTFEQVGGRGRRSKATTLEIRFDNVAPKASIREPADHSFPAGQTVNISGVAVDGWKASVPGGTIEMDKQHRFSGNVVFAGKNRSLAIRLSSAKRRVHYYLRRSGGGG